MWLRLSAGSLPLAAIAAAVGLLTCMARNTISPRGPVPCHSSTGRWEDAVRELDPIWSLNRASTLPEQVNSLALLPMAGGRPTNAVFAGTTRRGGVYRFNTMMPDVHTVVAEGLGDQFDFGDCCVNRLGFRDVDGDGTMELFASTSQVMPRGRPRLYISSFELPIPILRAVARPDIRSSWSHGLAFVPRPESNRDSVFLTFCGFGEIVEYVYDRGDGGSGFHRDSLSWKQVGQLPASGEWCETADIDNDGQDDLCFSVGYAEGAAAIHAYVSDAPGAPLRLEQKIEEDHRFGNVRFVIGNILEDGTKDVVAWWVTDHIYGGDCEMIRYRLGPEGILDRDVVARGKSDAMWPDDHQALLLDMDGDRRPEVWYATKSGNLWRYNPMSSPTPSLVLKMAPAIGPIAGGKVLNKGTQALFLGWGRDVLRLEGGPKAEPSPEPVHVNDQEFAHDGFR